MIDPERPSTLKRLIAQGVVDAFNGAGPAFMNTQHAGQRQ
jgi:hypothetical protein